MKRKLRNCFCLHSNFSKLLHTIRAKRLREWGEPATRKINKLIACCLCDSHWFMCEPNCIFHSFQRVFVVGKPWNASEVFDCKKPKSAFKMSHCETLTLNFAKKCVIRRENLVVDKFLKQPSSTNECREVLAFYCSSKERNPVMTSFLKMLSFSELTHRRFTRI